MGDSAKVLARRRLSLDSRVRLKFVTTQHHSISPGMLLELDPAYKEVTRKSFERRCQDDTVEQSCVIGIEFDLEASSIDSGLKVRSISIQLEMFADESY
jgi:hypothetical protein